jgi:hypothetical protein
VTYLVATIIRELKPNTAVMMKTAGSKFIFTPRKNQYLTFNVAIDMGTYIPRSKYLMKCELRIVNCGSLIIRGDGYKYGRTNATIYFGRVHSGWDARRLEHL